MSEYHHHINIIFNARTEAHFFISQLSRVPGFEDRLRAMVFKANFAEKVEEIKQVTPFKMIVIFKSEILSRCYFFKHIETLRKSVYFQSLSCIKKASEELRQSKRLEKVIQVNCSRQNT